MHRLSTVQPISWALPYVRTESPCCFWNATETQDTYFVYISWPSFYIHISTQIGCWWSHGSMSGLFMRKVVVDTLWAPLIMDAISRKPIASSYLRDKGGISCDGGFRVYLACTCLVGYVFYEVGLVSCAPYLWWVHGLFPKVLCQTSLTIFAIYTSSWKCKVASTIYKFSPCAASFIMTWNLGNSWGFRVYCPKD